MLLILADRADGMLRATVVFNDDVIPDERAPASDDPGSSVLIHLQETFPSRWVPAFAGTTAR